MLEEPHDMRIRYVRPRYPPSITLLNYLPRQFFKFPVYLFLYCDAVSAAIHCRASYLHVTRGSHNKMPVLFIYLPFHASILTSHNNTPIVSRSYSSGIIRTTANLLHHHCRNSRRVDIRQNVGNPCILAFLSKFQPL